MNILLGHIEQHLMCVVVLVLFILLLHSILLYLLLSQYKTSSCKVINIKIFIFCFSFTSNHSQLDL